MPAFTATAPGKIILFGEHAVVYGRPAIAAPVSQVQARAVVRAEPRAAPGEVRIEAPDIDLNTRLDELTDDHPLAATVYGVYSVLGIQQPPACTVRITSTIPVASGLGSGTAVSVAVIRALTAFLGQTMTQEQVSDLAYQIEVIYHGIPSGIDNTVVTFERPVYYIKGEEIQILRLPVPFTILIGDTGVPSSTTVAVGDVRRAWQADRRHYETIFDAIGNIVNTARAAIENGEIETLAPLMDENHAYLRQLGVSSSQLDRMVVAAREAGALGAKLSGGGRGGNMIALAAQQDVENVALALQQNGAHRVIVTEFEINTPE